MKPVIKINLEQQINSQRPFVIDLGCGQKPKKGRVTVDKVDMLNVDIVADIEEGLTFLPDNSVDELRCKSVLEHIDNFEYLMREIIRVLKPDGKAYIFVPHFSNPYYYSDYSHKRLFGLYTFYYFVDSQNQLKRKVPAFYTNIRIKIISTKLVFRSPFWVSKKIKKFIGFFINLHSSIMEFYELHLCYLFPCDGIRIVFSPGKKEK